MAMDPLSIASGTVGIISLSITVAQGLIQIADGIGSAEEEVRCYAEEINLFSNLLHRVKLELESSDDISADIQGLIDDIVGICESVFKPLNNLQELIKPLLVKFKNNARKVHQLALRIRWNSPTFPSIFMAAIDLSYRMARESNFQLLIKGPSPSALRPTTLTLEQAITAPDTCLEDTTAGPAVEYTSADSAFESEDIEVENSPLEQQMAWLTVSANQHDAFDKLLEDEIFGTIEANDCDIDYEPRRSEEDIWHDINMLQIQVWRVASQTLMSEVSRKSDRDRLDPKDYSVAWICAGFHGLVAACSFLDEQHMEAIATTSSDTNSYTLGKVGNHNFVIVNLPDGGDKEAIAAIGQDFKTNFPNVRFGLNICIGGGVPMLPYDVRPGDVVVGIPTSAGPGMLLYDSFDEEPIVVNPPTPLLAAVTKLRSHNELRGRSLNEELRMVGKKYWRLVINYHRPHPNTDLLFPATVLHCTDSDIPTDGKPCSNCDSEYRTPRPERKTDDAEHVQVHFGLVASGDQAVHDAILRDRLAEEKAVRCFQLNSEGLIGTIPCLAICGISNYADSHNWPGWNPFATLAATAYARQLMRYISSS
ncbi:unnamed protein product [Clonostachys rosea]|uniref:Fungal N-terminal domain-containing protein n=1 Tax=Bionectria ochroleuca TaxID=29856 RepID=A0ABY6U0S0_BIOOC|nr:unnamed protein product [Clonostachys rosea]